MATTPSDSAPDPRAARTASTAYSRIMVPVPRFARPVAEKGRSRRRSLSSMRGRGYGGWPHALSVSVPSTAQHSTAGIPYGQRAGQGRQRRRGPPSTEVNHVKGREITAAAVCPCLTGRREPRGDARTTSTTVQNGSTHTVYVAV